MIVLGIDSGTTETGWVVWDNSKKAIVPATFFAKVPQFKNRPKLMGKDNNNQLIRFILPVIFETHVVEVVGIEMFAGYGRSVGRSTFDACRWVGRFEELCLTSNLPVTLVYRKMDVCPWICRTVKAKDKDIRAALIKMYGIPGTKKKPGALYGMANDMWSALAIAVTTVEKYHAKT